MINLNLSKKEEELKEVKVTYFHECCYMSIIELLSNITENYLLFFLFSIFTFSIFINKWENNQPRLISLNFLSLIHNYVTRMVFLWKHLSDCRSCVTRILPVCTHMSFVCHSYVLVYYSYTILTYLSVLHISTCMFSFAILMPIFCTCMPCACVLTSNTH